MKQILILGAGKSSVYIIDYLIDHAEQWQAAIVVADTSIENLALRVGTRNAQKVVLKTGTLGEIELLFPNTTIVISMLPAAMHVAIAKLCLRYKSHLVTPSYVSDQMQSLHEEAVNNGLIFLNEMGLDPGIDHMSAKRIIDEWQAKGAKITGLKSHCGGLVAPESDTNLWHYKISWNPRNVVLAGAGTDFIKYKANGENISISYEQLFNHSTEIRLDEHYLFESYPNRDSLKYESIYGLTSIGTLYRGTLRVPPFCKGWSKVVELGMTSTTNPFPFISPKEASLDKETEKLLSELGVFEINNPTDKACDVLQKIIEKKWAMKPDDRDRVVVIHEFEMELDGKSFSLRSSLILDGENQIHTAMAKTVGLPIAFAVEMILNISISERGVFMPISKAIYKPILLKLETAGIHFRETLSK